MKSLIDNFIGYKDTDMQGLTVIQSADEEKTIPYSKMYAQSCKYLEYLQDMGVKSGSEVLFQIEDIDKFVFVFWACQLGGITAVPIDIGENDENHMKVIRIWKTLRAPFYLSDTNTLNQIAAYGVNDCSYAEAVMQIKERFINIVLPDSYTGKKCSLHNYREEDFISLIQFSSGSTGMPKGIPIKYSSLTTHVKDLAVREEVTDKDVMLNWSPLSHNLGLVSVHLVATYAGTKQFIMQKKLFVQNPVLWIEKANEHQATMIYSPNFGFKYFLSSHDFSKQTDWDLSHIRIVFNGAEPINYELCQSFTESLSIYGLAKNVMYPAYGCSESTSVISIPKVGDDLTVYRVDRSSLIIGRKVKLAAADDETALHLVSVGYPVENCEVRVCDSENEILNDFHIGNLQVRGVNVIDNYYNNEQATKEAFYQGGWFNTGDLCFRDGRNIVITGRAKEIIFIQGQNYFPHDIERIIEQSQPELTGKIAACGVFNEDVQTDEIIIFLELEIDINGAYSEMIRSLISRKLGLYAGKVIRIDKLEKTDSGKMQRLKMAQKYVNGDYDGCIQAKKWEEESPSDFNERSDKAIEQRMLSIWKETLSNEEMDIDDNFFDLGGTSSLLIVLNTKLSRYYNGLFSVTDIFKAPTVAQLSQLIAANADAEKSKRRQ